MIRSIFLKIILFFSIIIALLVIPLSLFSFRSIEDHMTHILKRDLRKIAVAAIPPSALLSDPGELDREIKILGKKINTRLTVIDTEGFVLADSENDPRLMENHKDRIEIRRALLKGEGFSIRYSDTEKKRMLYTAVPIRTASEEGTARGVIRASLYLEDITALNKELTGHLVGFLSVLILLALLLAFFLSRTLSAPIKAIAGASMAVSRGEFGVKVHLKNNDELKILADNFNYMTHQLSLLFQQARTGEEKIINIIEALDEALFVVDNHRNITLANNSFCNITSCPEPEGKKAEDIIPWPELLAFTDEKHKTKENAVQEISFEEKIWLAAVNHTLSGESIILLHDITPIKRAEKLKRDLVANVSHELRTPLTAIKGFIETLQETARDDQKRYFEIVADHTDRLIHIVRDLSALSSLEKGEKKPEEIVSLDTIIRDVSLLFEKRVRDKSLDFQLSLSEEPLLIKGDSFRLEQMMINLLENALKYTDHGSIEVSLSKENTRAWLTVKDTGIGIPHDKLERIFERFYVVDKSRSRQTGGTGLGLSIVKHIALLHGASVDVRSLEGQGSCFSFGFPLLK